MRLFLIFSVFLSLSAHAASGANQQTLQALKWELWEEGVSALKETPVDQKSTKLVVEEVSYILDKFGL
jgi:hypothetical protein